MSLLKQYSWEMTHITAIAGVVTTLALVVHLSGTPRVETDPYSPPSAQSAPAAHPAHVFAEHKTTHHRKSDPYQIVVGPSGISNRYTLLGVDRKPVSATLDELTVRLRVESLAPESLVSPFESDMLEIKGRGQDPISPNTPFRSPVPGGQSRNQDIVFSIPSSLKLSDASLQIHYYNYRNDIALNR